jgi:hypothetical protein
LSAPPPALNSSWRQQEKTMSKMKRELEKQQEKQTKQKKENQQEQQSNLPATKFENPWLEVAAENSGGLGKLLKFVKGKWEIGDDEVPIGTEYIAHIDQLAQGWVHFEDGEVVGDPIIVKIADGKKLPTREELGNTDKKKWEEGEDGKPRDPFVKQWYLPLVNIDSGELHTFVSGSNGGDQAIGALCNVYGRKLHDGQLPIVALQSSGYKHRKYGRIEKPELRIVGWDGEPKAPITVTSPQSPPQAGNGTANADMGGDSIPY